MPQLAVLLILEMQLSVIFFSRSRSREISSGIPSTSSSSASNTGNSKLGDDVRSLCSMGLRNNLHNDFDMKSFLKIKQDNRYADEKIAFILVFRVFCDHQFHAKSEKGK